MNFIQRDIAKTTSTSSTINYIYSGNTSSTGLSLTSTLITDTLGYIPYNSSNPNGFITNSSLNNYLPLTGGILTGDLTVNSTTQAEFDNNIGSIYTLGGITAKKDVQCLSLYSQSDIFTDGNVNIGGSYNGNGSGLNNIPITALAEQPLLKSGGIMAGDLNMNYNYNINNVGVLSTSSVSIVNRVNFNSGNAWLNWNGTGIHSNTNIYTDGYYYGNGGGLTGTSSNLTVGYSKLLTGINTTSTNISNYNPLSLTYQAWGQAFTHSSITSDSGDIAYWLRQSQYTTGKTELCVVIDGDYYANGTNKVIHSGSIGSQSVNYATTAGSATSATTATNATYATTAGRAYPYKTDGTPINLNWSVQTGQTWVIGSANGTDFYVYNPSNFSVNYATTAGSATSISSAAVVSGLGYTPYNATNPAGYLTGINSGQVTTALGFTPYNSTNPAGYTTNTGTVTSITAGAGLSGGAITTSGTISLTSGIATAGTYKSVTVDTYGRVTAGTNPTTVAGYGITDAITTSNISSQSVNYATTAGSTGYLTTSLTGTNGANLIYATIADNDYFRLRVSGTATNAGYVELATADDGTEPIYISQYTGTFTSLARRLTLLDSAGNTSLPCQLTVNSTTEGEFDNNKGSIYTLGGITCKKSMQCHDVYASVDIAANGSVYIGGSFNGSGSGLSGTASSLSVNYATYADRLNNSQAHTNGTDGWWRSNGNCGWYNESYATGIYSTESGNVRTYNNSSFIANKVTANSYFKTTSNCALAGDYDTAGTTDKIIWTIGDSWTVLTGYYGLGYTYNNVAGFGHSLCMANAGTKMINFSLEYGSAKFVGNVTASQFIGSGAGLTGTASSLNVNYATYSTNAQYTDYLPNRSDSTAYPILWGSSQGTNSNTGNAKTYAFSCPNVTITSSTGAINANVFNGSGAGLTGTASSLTAGTATTCNSWNAGTSISTSGYLKLGNGLIFQWRYLTAGSTTYTFPIAFPTSCLSVHVTTNRTTTGSSGANHVGNLTASQFYAVIDGTTGWMFAIGY